MHIPNTQRQTALGAAFLTVFSLSILPTCSLQAATPGVTDNAGLFSALAIEKAGREVADVKQKYKKDIAVETFKSIPASERTAFDGLSKTEKNKFFAKWADDRATELELDGVYILITEEPKHLQLWVGRNTQAKAFTTKDREELEKRMLGSFNARKYDQGLLEGLSFIRSSMKGHIKLKENHDQRAADEGFNWKGLICPALIIGGVMWLVFGLIRGLSGMGASGGMAGGGAGGWGGGGFMSGMLGGLFGAVAGNWLYHSFLGGHSGGAWGSSANADDPSSGTDFGPSDEGHGDSTGADFGDGTSGDATGAEAGAIGEAGAAIGVGVATGEGEATRD
jgi:uncharacterized protein